MSTQNSPYATIEQSYGISEDGNRRLARHRNIKSQETPEERTTMRIHSTILLSALLLVSTSCTTSKRSEPVTSKPGINDAFLDPNLDVDKWVHRFEVESREVFAARNEIVENLHLAKGDVVADIGTGTGLFVEPMSHAVGPDGWVYAQDIAPKFIQRIGQLSKLKGLGNVTPVLGGEDDVMLQRDSIDVAFICDVYHHFEFPEKSLASLYAAVKPGGQLVVIDFERIPGKSREWVLNHVRAGKDAFRKEIEDAGFEFVEEAKIATFKENYFLRFKHP